MRARFLLIFFACCLAGSRVEAQEKTVQNFSGTGTLTATPFTVGDKWEVRWDSAGLISITILAADGTVVEGAAGSAQGSIYAPKGGTFHLQINAAPGNQPWHVSVVEMDGVPAIDQAPASANYVPPSVPTANAVAASTNLMAAPSGPTNAPSTPAVPKDLTEDQSHALVLIKGEVAEGTGFLAKTKDGPAVITNLHVIAANPNLHILSATGEEIKTTRLEGATDRDLAMFLIQDDHYSYLDLADLNKDDVETYDAVITPGNSEGGEVMLNTKGRILGIGPEKVEIDNPVYHGNSGGPVFHLKSGKVVGVVTEGVKVRPSDALDKASAANADSAITGTVRYFALRVDSVPGWEPYDENQFLAQTTFLKNFQDVNRALDSFLNGARYDKAGVSGDGEEMPPNARYFLSNDKIRGFVDTFHESAKDSDDSAKLDAQRELLMDLQGQAEGDLATIQNAGNFYSFEEQQAQRELKYRVALKEELEKIGDKISDLGH